MSLWKRACPYHPWTYNAYNCGSDINITSLLLKSMCNVIGLMWDSGRHLMNDEYDRSVILLIDCSSHDQLGILQYHMTHTQDHVIHQVMVILL